jgi:hypothetical protein
LWRLVDTKMVRNGLSSAELWNGGVESGAEVMEELQARGKEMEGGGAQGILRQWWLCSWLLAVEKTMTATMA